jgi:hypothetical protein
MRLRLRLRIKINKNLHRGAQRSTESHREEVVRSEE